MNQKVLKVLVTGSNGFIGSNLVLRLSELAQFKCLTFVRGDSYDDLSNLVHKADAIVHLAGENRPLEKVQFDKNNSELTKFLCQAISKEAISYNRKIPLILASSQQALLDNPYGKSKLKAERFVRALSEETLSPAFIYRLPGVFGKWCKPNYNSVVATFCNNIATGKSIQIDDPNRILSLVYIDDVIDSFIECLEGSFNYSHVEEKIIDPVYSISLAELAEKIQDFSKSRETLISERVGNGFLRALYSTYVSYLPHNKFKYPIASHEDERGIFVEMLKTKDSGQFSFFTALPGITRGGHYHHTKTEKFLVIKGEALFRFKHLITNEVYTINTSGKSPMIVETIPGWSHDITNTGKEELIAMLWANEIFDHNKPDTIGSELQNEKT